MVRRRRSDQPATPMREIPALRFALLMRGAPHLDAPSRCCAVMRVLRSMLHRTPASVPALAPSESAAAPPPSSNAAAATGGAPAADATSSSRLLWPPPPAHRLLTTAMAIRTLSQLLLSHVPAVVEGAADLLVMLFADGAGDNAVAKLYTRGSLLLRAHVRRQLVRAGRAPARGDARPSARLGGLGRRGRGRPDAPGRAAGTLRPSILGAVLPASMIEVLRHYSPEEWAAHMSRDVDTPDAIWDGSMRDAMRDAIGAHVGTMRTRLAEDPRLVYFVPIAPIGYERLDDELWCYGYYLRNLCDAKFSDWTIRSPAGLLRACLQSLHSQLRAPKLALSVAEAAATLRLDEASVGDTRAVRRAYFAIARTCHPDKTSAPDARACFERAQLAYEVLSSASARAAAKARAGEKARRSSRSLVEDADAMIAGATVDTGEDAETEAKGANLLDDVAVRLILKAHVILYEGDAAKPPTERALASFRYPSFAVAMALLERELRENGLDRVAQLTMLARVIDLVASAAPGNASSLLEAGGAVGIPAALGRVLPLARAHTPSDRRCCSLVAALVGSILALAPLPRFRAHFAREPLLPSNLVECLELKQHAPAVEAALDAIDALLAPSRPTAQCAEAPEPAADAVDRRALRSSLVALPRLFAQLLGFVLDFDPHVEDVVAPTLAHPRAEKLASVPWRAAREPSSAARRRAAAAADGVPGGDFGRGLR